MQFMVDGVYKIDTVRIITWFRLHLQQHVTKQFLYKPSVNPFTPTDLYGMFQIKVWTIPF